MTFFLEIGKSESTIRFVNCEFVNVFPIVKYLLNDNLSYLLFESDCWMVPYEFVVIAQEMCKPQLVL